MLAALFRKTVFVDESKRVEGIAAFFAVSNTAVQQRLYGEGF